jgi:hypothetical protein
MCNEESAKFGGSKPPKVAAKARQLEKSESARSSKTESPASRHEGRVSHSQKWSAMSPNRVTVGAAANSLYRAT